MHRLRSSIHRGSGRPSTRNQRQGDLRAGPPPPPTPSLTTPPTTAASTTRVRRGGPWWGSVGTSLDRACRRGTTAQGCRCLRAGHSPRIVRTPLVHEGPDCTRTHRGHVQGRVKRGGCAADHRRRRRRRPSTVVTRLGGPEERIPQAHAAPKRTRADGGTQVVTTVPKC